MFRANSRKGYRRIDDNGLTGMLVHNLERAENLINTDFELGHDHFVRAEEIYGSLCRDAGRRIPEIEFRLDELYIAYQMKIDLNL